MYKPIRNILTLSVVLILILSACNLPSQSQQTEEPNLIFTQAAMTVQAQLTQSAPVFNTPTLPPPPPTSTPITLPTAVVPTNTVVVSPTPQCDQAQFIKDVTIPDGTLITPGSTFKKTWRLKNIGTCTWSGYTLVFDAGESMSPAIDPIPTVASGQEVDVSVTFTAPMDNKSVRSYWRIRNSAGVLFPVIGGHENKSFFVDIKVGVVSSGYDFYSRATSAVWTNSTVTLTFGGPDSDNKGFAMYKNDQKLENGTTPGKVLETHPQFIDNGMISGRFPAYTIVKGEHFTATLGFLALSDGTCGAGNVKFQLNYKESGGSLTPLTEWTKSCDGTLKPVDVDLSSLAGKNIEFILAVLANGPSTQDWAVWVKPQIALP